MGQDRLVHVVDDEESIRRSLHFLLRTAGFQVEKWDDGEAFLTFVEERLCNRQVEVDMIEAGRIANG